MGRSLTTRRVRTRWARGVSLLETLVALSIAVAGLAVALTAVAQSARASEAVERSRREVALAKALVEEAFLGLMSEEQKAESTASADIWRGVDERGLAWEVTITSSLMGAFNARADGAEAGLGQIQGVAPGQMVVEMITVRVGSTELRTTRW
jgi:type II secretory pathway pseudopilin PulG